MIIEEQKELFYKNLKAAGIFLVIVISCLLIAQFFFKPITYQSIEGCKDDSQVLKSVKDCQIELNQANQDNTINLIVFTVTIALVLSSIALFIENQIIKHSITVASICLVLIKILSLVVSRNIIELPLVFVSLIILFNLINKEEEYDFKQINIIGISAVITILLIILTNTITSGANTGWFNLNSITCHIITCQ